MAQEDSVDLDKLADSLNKTNSLVEGWLKDSAPKRKLSRSNVHSEGYNDLGRPARLGIGAKLKPKGSEATIFDNYKLKMKLLGQEKLDIDDGNDTLNKHKRKLPSKPLVQKTSTKKPIPLPRQKDDEESRSKAVGALKANKFDNKNVLLAYKKQKKQNKDF